jgi:hypothetical protein
MLRGLALVAALVAVCAFHGSASEPVDARLAAGPVAAAPASDLVGPLHLDFGEVPSAFPVEEHHAHVLVVFLLGGLLLGLVVRRLAGYAVGDLWRTTGCIGVTDPPCSVAPSLTRLCVLRT